MWMSQFNAESIAKTWTELNPITINCESENTPDLRNVNSANGMTTCSAHEGDKVVKETMCLWFKLATTAKRCMYWRESCECCDKLIDKEGKELN